MFERCSLREDRKIQGLHQQTGQFQFLGCDPLSISAEFVQRTDFVAVEEQQIRIASQR